MEQKQQQAQEVHAKEPEIEEQKLSIVKTERKENEKTNKQGLGIAEGEEKEGRVEEYSEK